jgi:HEAT repeats
MRGEGIMTCGQAKELMADAWISSGDSAVKLDRDVASELRRHLVGCEECGAELPALSDLWRRLGEMPVPEPSRAMHQRWRETFEGFLPKPVPQRFVPKQKRWPPLSLANLWPRSPVWQAAIALACLLVGLFAGALASNSLLPRHDNEIAKLHDEIASTRAMVALSLLQQQSATERLRGVDYTDRMQTMEPQVISALVEAVSRDPSVNVRLAAIDALGKAADYPGVLQSLRRSLPQQDSPMVQASLVDFLVDAHDRQAVGMLRQLASQPDLNPAVLERTDVALQQLSR